jgi:Glycosyl transferase family 2
VTAAGLPAISVAMPNYNHARFLRDSVGGLLAQTLAPLEIVIVDDCSTDESWELLQEFAAANPIIRLHRNQRNLGARVTLAGLTERVRGDYVLYAGADDVTFPTLIEKSAKLLARYPGAAYCCAATLLIDEHGRSRGVASQTIASKSPCYLAPEEIRGRLCRYGHEGWFVAGNTAIYKRTAMIEAGGHRPELYSFQDGLVQRVLGLKYGACHIPEPLAAWRVMRSGMFKSMSVDPEIAPRMIEAATRIIETEYPGLFPEGYVEQMHVRLALDLRLGALQRRQDSLRARLAAGPLGRGPLARVVNNALRVHYHATNLWLRRRLGLRSRSLMYWKLRDALNRRSPRRKLP